MKKVALLIMALCCSMHQIYASWADDMLRQMTLEQKVGQLFIVCSNENFNDHASLNYQFLKKVITQLHIGNVLIFGMPTAKQTVDLIQSIHKWSSVPPFIMLDAEYGLCMRIQDCIQFPRALTLGAIQNNDLIYKIGYEIGRQCNIMGIHVNIAPVADLYNKKSYIGMRSFGDNPHHAGIKASHFCRGLQNAHIIACAKHFPGHGNTSTDSHQSLPVIQATKQELQDNEYVPFRHLIEAGIQAIMVGHLAIPAEIGDQITPASLSRSIIQDLLRTELGFDGLIMPDALRMRSIVNYLHHQSDVLQAWYAGHDFLLGPDDTIEAYYTFLQAVKNGTISVDELDKKVYKILKAKEEIYNNGGMPDQQQIPTLWGPEAYQLQQEAYQQAMTIFHNTAHLIPVSEKQSTACIIFDKTVLPFTKELTAYKKISIIDAQKIKLVKKLNANSVAIVPITDKIYTSPDLFNKCIDRLKKYGCPIIFVLFSNPSILADPAIGINVKMHTKTACLIAYEDTIAAQKAAARIVAGIIPARGKLPIQI